MILVICLGCESQHISSAGPKYQNTVAVSVTDFEETTHQFLKPPTRIISLVPSATETLLSMGVGNSLIARTEFDNAPAMLELPSVGPGLNPDLEILLSVRPDLVIGFSGESNPSIKKHLENSGVTAFMIRPDKLEDIIEIIKKLSLITDRVSLGDSIILSINTSLETVKQKVANENKIRVAYILGGEPPWVAGPNTYIHQLILAGGGQNVFRDLKYQYVPVSLEEFFVRPIDVVLSTENTNLPINLKSFETVTLPSSFEIPGPRLGQAVFELAKALHPKVFP